MEAMWPSGQGPGLDIRRSPVYVPLWPLRRSCFSLDPGSAPRSYQLVYLPPAGIFTPIMFSWYICFFQFKPHAYSPARCSKAHWPLQITTFSTVSFWSTFTRFLTFQKQNWLSLPFLFIGAFVWKDLTIPFLLAVTCFLGFWQFHKTVNEKISALVLYFSWTKDQNACCASNKQASKNSCGKKNNSPQGLRDNYY